MTEGVVLGTKQNTEVVLYDVALINHTHIELLSVYSYILSFFYFKVNKLL